MSLKEVIILIAVFGILIFAVHKATFIPEPWKTYSKWFLVAMGILYVLNQFGFWAYLDKIRIGP